MRNHTLMQTIARANRVFPALAQAMAIYSAGVGGATPAQPKTQLAAMLRAAVMVATAFCAEHGVDLAALEALPLDSLDRLTALEAAIDALLAPDGRRATTSATCRWCACPTTQMTTEDMLDAGLPRPYAPDLYQQKCAALFEHIYESYPERNAGVYAVAA